MNPVQTPLESTSNPVHSVLWQSQTTDRLHTRIEALIQAQQLRLVANGGANGVELQSNNGPKLSLPSKMSSTAEQQRVVWQVRAFIDAVEAAA